MTTEAGKKNTFIAKLMGRYSTAAKFLWSHLSNPESCTYYPNEKRKSNAAIWLDNLRWMLKHHEINHFYYLYGFDREKDINQNDYIATDEFFRLREKVNKTRMGKGRIPYFCILQDKFFFGQYLKALGFPTPVNLAICDRGKITWLDSQQDEPLESLLSRDGLDVFVKDLLGESAKKIYPLRVENRKLFIDKKETTVEELRKMISEKSVIQQRLYQHPQMSKLHPNSLNTIRIVTVFNDDDAAVPLSAVLRVGVKGRQFDNWAAGGTSLAIDLETGRLGRNGICKPGLGGIITQHPDTGVIFEGFEIPYFSKVVQMVCSLHGFFYGVHSVGWDVAVTKEGPAVVEGNNLWEVSIMQAHDSDVKRKFMASLPRELRPKNSMVFSN